MNSVIVVESSDEDELHLKIRQNKNVEKKQRTEYELVSTKTAAITNNNISKSLKKSTTKPECDSIMKSKQNVKSTIIKPVNSHFIHSAKTPTPVKIFSTVKTIIMPKTISSSHNSNPELSNISSNNIKSSSNVKKNVSQTKIISAKTTTTTPAKTTDAIQPKKTKIVSTPLKILPQTTAVKLVAASAQLVSLKTQSIPFTAKHLPPLQPSPQMQNQMRKRKLIAPIMTTTPTEKTSTSEAKISRPNITKQISRESVTGVKTINNNNNNNKGTLAVKSTPQSPLPVVLPNCSTFNSIDADVMPPLQLMATPPHQSSAFSNNEKGTTTKKTNDNNNNINNNNKISTNTLAQNNNNNKKISTNLLAQNNKEIVELPKTLQCPPHKSPTLMKEKDKSSNGIITIQDISEETPLKARENNVTVKPETKSNCEREIIFVKNKPVLVSVDLSAIDLTISPEILSPCHDKEDVNTANKTTTITRNTATNEKSSSSKLLQSNVEESSIGENSKTEPIQTPEYIELLKVLRKADNSPDMETLIEKKLNKYYTAVSYSSFIKSRGFRKNMRSVIDMINRDPDLVYFHLKSVIEELKSRYHCKPTRCEDDASFGSDDIMSKAESEKEESPQEVIKSDESSHNSTTSSLNKSKEKNKQINMQIQKLNAALHVLTKNIEKLEQAEVDFDDEDSSYLQVERLKKRACQIYNKICDLTGESKNAHRLIKKPIQFNGTQFPQFNKTLRAYINRTKEFPDYYDVLHMVEHCNRKYEFGLANYQINRLAEDAFIQVGKLLQARRKTDLYETVSHFTANASDPAKNDPLLLAKLNENKQVQKRIGDVIAKYAREQDRVLEEQRALRRKSEDSNGKVFLCRNKIKLKQDINYSSCEDNSEDYNENTDTEDEALKNDELVKNEKPAMVKGQRTEKNQINDDNRINASITPSKECKEESEQSRTSKSLLTNNAQELKISSVYTLISNKPATPITTRKTPRPITVSSTTIPIQDKEMILDKSTRPLMEIWISDDEDELAKKKTTLEKAV